MTPIIAFLAVASVVAAFVKFCDWRIRRDNARRSFESAKHLCDENPPHHCGCPRDCDEA